MNPTAIFAHPTRSTLTDDPDRLLNADELAALMKVHRTTIYRWWNQGRLPQTRIFDSPRMTVQQYPREFIQTSAASGRIQA